MFSDFLSTNCYCFKSFADRDMLMRYYWGLSMGDTYAYQSLWRPTLSICENTKNWNIKSTLGTQVKWCILPHSAEITTMEVQVHGSGSFASFECNDD